MLNLIVGPRPDPNRLLMYLRIWFSANSEFAPGLIIEAVAWHSGVYWSDLEAAGHARCVEE